MQQLSQFDFHHTLEETPGIALVFFSTADCGSCRHWDALLADYDRAHAALTVFRVDAQQDMALAREFEVFHLPALFLYRDGVFHCALQAEASAAALQRAIEAALQAPVMEAP